MPRRYWREAKRAQADALFVEAYELRRMAARCLDLVVRATLLERIASLVDRAAELDAAAVGVNAGEETP